MLSFGFKTGGVIGWYPPVVFEVPEVPFELSVDGDVLVEFY
jgi:hypothetical protein